jgi:hypothetical protein
MTEMHLFVPKRAKIGSLKEALALGYKLHRLEAEIDAWVEENEVRNFLKTEGQKHIGSTWAGWDAPAWAFYNELDALQFKMIWGAMFDYSAIASCEEVS